MLQTTIFGDIQKKQFTTIGRELEIFEGQPETRDPCCSAMNNSLLRARSCITVEEQHLKDIIFRS